jgi:acyl-CoA reductase-like NAD-dependent aldehyde dehydrogenase
MNAGIISNEIAPFGGVKQSGNGRDLSLHAFEKYLDLKTTWISVGEAAA